MVCTGPLCYATPPRKGQFDYGLAQTHTHNSGLLTSSHRTDRHHQIIESSHIVSDTFFHFKNCILFIAFCLRRRRGLYSQVNMVWMVASVPAWSRLQGTSTCKLGIVKEVGNTAPPSQLSALYSGKKQIKRKRKTKNAKEAKFR